MIDTESDKPTRDNPRPKPALLQVQAIYNNIFSTVFVIETQHLPHQTTSLFHLIQQLCQAIFSPSNRIMAWGDISQELKPFEQFNLFDISKITNTLNVQEFFTQHWNRTHPYTDDCINRHQPHVEEFPSDYLECFVNINDLEDDFNPTYPNDDYTTCICPNHIRPYKMKNPMWGLQKAVRHIFNQALDKTLTFNFWSCGLDLKLNIWRSHQDKYTRQSLIQYALNDLFAPTNLFFYFENLRSSQTPGQSVHLNTIVTQSKSTESPSFFILSDSHGRYLPPFLKTSQFTLTSKFIPGLQWINNHDTNFCAQFHLLSSSISSILSSSTNIFLLIGTNSIRSTPALQILTQVENVVDLIRIHYQHFLQKRNITIACVFPCLKVSTSFPSHSSLLQNIITYNTGLYDLSIRKDFTVVDLNITEAHLDADAMHLHHSHQHFLFANIRTFLDTFTFSQQLDKPPKSHHRSKAAIARRTKKRQNKLKDKLRLHTLVRPIARAWQLQSLKDYLKSKNINFNRLPEIYNRKLRIQFYDNNTHQHAERTLSTDEFTEEAYHKWISNAVHQQ